MRRFLLYLLFLCPAMHPQSAAAAGRVDPLHRSEALRCRDSLDSCYLAEIGGLLKGLEVPESTIRNIERRDFSAVKPHHSYFDPSSCEDTFYVVPVHKHYSIIMRTNGAADPIERFLIIYKPNYGPEIGERLKAIGFEEGHDDSEPHAIFSKGVCRFVSAGKYSFEKGTVQIIRNSEYSFDNIFGLRYLPLRFGCFDNSDFYTTYGLLTDTKEIGRSLVAPVINFFRYLNRVNCIVVQRNYRDCGRRYY